MTGIDISVVPHSYTYPLGGMRLAQSPVTTTWWHDIELGMPLVTFGRGMFDLDIGGDVNMRFARAVNHVGGIHFYGTNNLDVYDRTEVLEELAEEGVEYGIEVTPYEFVVNRRALEQLPCYISVRGPQSYGSIGIPESWSGKYPIILGNILSPAVELPDEHDYIYRVGSGEGNRPRMKRAGVEHSTLHTLKEISYGQYFIADGDDVWEASDVSKRLVAGATAVAVSRLMAGTKESPQLPVKVDGKWYKPYYTEGVPGTPQYQENLPHELIPYEERSVWDVALDITDSIVDIMTYTGVVTLEQLKGVPSTLVMSSGR